MATFFIGMIFAVKKNNISLLLKSPLMWYI